MPRGYLPTAGLILALASPAVAADRFVSTRGADGANACLVAATPCRTIGHALGQAGSGDVVNVAKGNYRESLVTDASITVAVVGGWDPTFTQRSLGRNRPRIAPPAKNMRVWTIDAGAGETIDVTLDGLIIRNGQAFGGAPSASGIFARAGLGGVLTLQVVDSLVEKNSSTGAGTGTLHVYAKDGGTITAMIERSVFARNQGARGAGIQVTGGPIAPVVTIVNTAIAQSQRPRMAQDAAQAITLLGPVQAAIVNSTITRNSGIGLFTDEEFPLAGAPTVDLRNTILWNNPAKNVGADVCLDCDGSTTVPTTIDLTSNDIGTQTEKPETIVNDLGGNLSVDPRLRGTVLLKPDSPMIDAGTSVGAPSDDIDGDARPNGAGVDIGADELVP